MFQPDLVSMTCSVAWDPSLEPKRMQHIVVQEATPVEGARRIGVVENRAILIPASHKQRHSKRSTLVATDSC